MTDKLHAANGITLSELQDRIKRILCSEFGTPVWITAEIGDLKVNHSSGHCYMELVEKGGANGVPKAQSRAVAWRNVWGMLSSYFEGATGKKLTAGMKVLLGVTVSYHELYGLSLTVHDIDPLYTLGDLEQQKQQTITQLKNDGVFDLNRELELPVVIQSIAIVSSPSAAGLQDFMNELQASGYRFEVTLYEAVMQGHGAEASIIEALSRVAGQWEDYDAVLLIRGGGSQSDLSFLNSYMLCSHIAQYPIPVITGLGHDKDVSIADMVAAVPLKTPTAVAGFLVNTAARTEDMLDELAAQLSANVTDKLSREEARMQALASALQNRTSSFARGIEIRLERLAAQTERLARERISLNKQSIAAMGSLISERVSRVLTASINRIEQNERLAQSYDPRRILERGFAIVRKDGRAVRDASGLAAGDLLEITLNKGEINAQITDTHK